MQKKKLCRIYGGPQEKQEKQEKVNKVLVSEQDSNRSNSREKETNAL